jgi:hypothetical protein
VLTAALQHRGEDVTMTYLYGASSRAFRLQFSWCPSAPHAYVGFNCFNPALKAMGYEATQHAGTFTFLQEAPKEAVPSTEAQREETCKVVKAAVDAAEAVIFGSEEDALLVGYEPVSDENPTGWLCRPGPLGGPPPDDEPYVLPVKQMPWGLCTLRKVSDPMPRGDAALWAIKTAVINAERGTVEGEDLKTGFAAWQKWIDELPTFDQVVEKTRKDLDEQGRDDDPAFQLQLGNAWTYENLYFARLEAARYLRDIAPDMPEEMRSHIEKAADKYEETKKALVPEGDCFTKIAPYPWTSKEKSEPWTDAMRMRQAGLLRDALKHERAAIEALKAALNAMDKEPAAAR